VEPGHQFEWAWILARAQALFGWPLGEDIGALVGFAEENGVDPATGVTFNSVRDDGAPLDRGSRTWPNTERIKGCLAMAEAHGVDPRPAVGPSCALLLQRNLDPETGARVLPVGWIGLRAAVLSEPQRYRPR